MYYSVNNDRVFGLFINSRGLRIILGQGNVKANAIINMADALAIASGAVPLTISVDSRINQQWISCSLSISSSGEYYTLTFDGGGMQTAVNINNNEYNLLQTICKQLPTMLGIAEAIHQVQTANNYSANRGAGSNPQAPPSNPNPTPPPTNPGGYNNGGASTPPTNSSDDFPF